MFFSSGGGSIGDSTESGSLEAAMGQSSDNPSETGGALRPSKSDTSLTDSFVVVSAPESPALTANRKPPKEKPVVEGKRSLLTLLFSIR